MIEIKNTGKKLVHIGKTPLMPGESVKVSDKVAVTPAIKVFAKRGILSLTEVKEEAAAATTETAKTEETAKAEKTEETADATAEKAATATAKKTTSSAAKTAK